MDIRAPECVPKHSEPLRFTLSFPLKHTQSPAQRMPAKKDTTKASAQCQSGGPTINASCRTRIGTVRPEIAHLHVSDVAFLPQLLGCPLATYSIHPFTGGTEPKQTPSMVHLRGAGGWPPYADPWHWRRVAPKIPVQSWPTALASLSGVPAVDRYSKPPKRNRLGSMVAQGGGAKKEAEAI